MTSVSVGFEVRDFSDKARDFHSELMNTDLPRKNALRHAYWTAMLSRRFGMYFSLNLSTAHEEDHVDLTIEGPLDHVTDKINNAVGSLLRSRSKNLQDVIDTAWKNKELAYAKGFRETSAGQTAQVFWEKPLDMMAKKVQCDTEVQSDGERYSDSEEDEGKYSGCSDHPLVISYYASNQCYVLCRLKCS
jgi:hypothetical protein